MHMPSDESYPRICLEVGLDCETCTSGTAIQVAAVCKGLSGKAIAQMFVQIYPSLACSGMHSHFAAHYNRAHRTSLSEVAPVLTMVAVA